jgi:hypothetical protein
MPGLVLAIGLRAMGIADDIVDLTRRGSLRIVFRAGRAGRGSQADGALARHAL